MGGHPFIDGPAWKSSQRPSFAGGGSRNPARPEFFDRVGILDQKSPKP